MKRPSIRRRIAYMQMMTVTKCNLTQPLATLGWVRFRESEPATYRRACRMANRLIQFSRGWLRIPAAWAYVRPRGVDENSEPF